MIPGDTLWLLVTRQKVEPDAQESMSYHYNHRIFNVSLLVIISDFSISSCDYHLVTKVCVLWVFILMVVLFAPMVVVFFMVGAIFVLCNQ